MITKTGGDDGSGDGGSVSGRELNVFLLQTYY